MNFPPQASSSVASAMPTSMLFLRLAKLAQLSTTDQADPGISMISQSGQVWITGLPIILVPQANPLASE